MPRFLVVDDDHPTVRAVSTLLAIDGHEVAAFTGGKPAVEAMSKAPFDAIVTDLEMPDVDGYAVLQGAREHAPHACFVVVTGVADQHRERLTEAGACMVLNKPLELEELAQTIGRCRGGGGRPSHGRCHLRAPAADAPAVPLRRK